MFKFSTMIILTLGLCFAQITAPVATGTTVDWDLDLVSSCSAPVYYRIDVGSSPGSSDFGNTGVVLASSGIFGTGPFSVDLSMTSGISLPTDGSVVNVRIWTFSSNCGWRFFNLTVDTSSLPPPPEPVPVSFLSPACDTEVSGETTFSWTPGDFTVLFWRLDLGTSLGGSDIGSSGILPSATTMATLSIDSESLLATGATVAYGRLWYFSGGWKILNCTFPLGGGSGGGLSCTGDFEIIDGGDDGSPGQLRDIVENQASSGDVICISTDIVLNSQLNLTKNLTLIGKDALFTISSSGENRHFGVTGSSPSVSIKNLIFTGGGAVGLFPSPASRFGGGSIFLDSSCSLNLENCVFSGNTTEFTDFIPNSGGAIHSRGTLTMTSCVFSGNTAESTGGALFIFSGSTTIDSCTFSENTVSDTVLGYGGAIILDNNASLTITNSTFSGNTGVEGGALSVSVTATLSCISCTFSGNHGNIGGGAIFCDGGSSEFLACTISGNSVGGFGGGIFISGGAVSLGNTIVSGNTAISGANVNGSFTSLGFNAFGSMTTDAISTDINGVFVTLLPLGIYGGGETETMPPCEISVALDVGDPSLSGELDQNGNSRGVGAGVDIGAVERQGDEGLCDL